MATALCRDRGKVRLLFKGLKKSRRRSRSAGEPGSLLSAVSRKSRTGNYSIVSDFCVKGSCDAISRDYSKIMCMHFMLELSDKTTAGSDPDCRVYDLLLAALSALSETEHPVRLACTFTAHLIRSHGLLGGLNCRICGCEPDTGSVLETSNLSMLCGSCREPGGHYAGRGIQQFFRDCLSGKFRDLDQCLYSEEDVRRLLFYLTEYIEQYFNIVVKSRKLLYSC